MRQKLTFLPSEDSLALQKSQQNPQKKFILKDDLANQISIKVINKCGWSFGLSGKEGINYFKKYFLEINEKTTPNKKLSG